MSAYSTRTEHLATGQSLDRWITTLHQAASARSSQPLPPPHEWVRPYWPGRNIFVNDIEAILMRGTPISDDDLRSLIDALNDIAFIHRIKSTSPAAIRKAVQKSISTTEPPKRQKNIKMNRGRFKHQVYVVLKQTLCSFTLGLGYSRTISSTTWIPSSSCPQKAVDALGITTQQLNTALDRQELLDLQQAEKELNVRRRTRREQAEEQAAAA